MSARLGSAWPGGAGASRAACGSTGQGARHAGSAAMRLSQAFLYGVNTEKVWPARVSTSSFSKMSWSLKLNNWRPACSRLAATAVSRAIACGS